MDIWGKLWCVEFSVVVTDQTKEKYFFFIIVWVDFQKKQLVAKLNVATLLRTIAKLNEYISLPFQKKPATG